jgi:predicted peptidase
MSKVYVRPLNIINFTGITEVFEDGQKVTAVVIEYDQDINNSKLVESTFSVSGRTITRVYANNTATRALHGTNGRFVIIELSIKDKEALTFNYVMMPNKLRMEKKKIKVSLTRPGDIFTADGEKYSPDSNVIVNDKVINIVVDDFLKFEYKDLKKGERLKYNLFIPQGYDGNKPYPLILFMPDGSVDGIDSDQTLIHGLGGLIWATPADQAKHPCFVLAPQYTRAVFKEERFETTIDLINFIVNKYNIDTNRIYTTGQSGGCNASIAMNIKYPDVFAASLLIAGHWDPAAMSVLTRNNMWLVVSEGDEREFPSMNENMASLEAAGAKISRAKWDGRSGKEDFDSKVNKMIAEGNYIKYTVLAKGTVVPEDLIQDSVNNHFYAWRIAYTIEGLRDWLFAQVKTPRI